MPGECLLAGDGTAVDAAAVAQKGRQRPVGTLAQFPSTVVLCALGGAASDGDEVLLRQLLSLPGIDVNRRCGPAASPLFSLLHLAAQVI